MQTNTEKHDELVPFTLDDLKHEQDGLKVRLENLRKGFFSRYVEWEKVYSCLKKENETLKAEIELIKGENILENQEIVLGKYRLEA